MLRTMEVDVDGASKYKFNGEWVYKEDIDASDEMEHRTKRLKVLDDCYVITKKEEQSLTLMGILSLSNASKLKEYTSGEGGGDT
jgi:hypothetical protein